MLAYVIRRILVLIPTLLGVSIIVFLMLHLTPGDPAELLLGERASKEALQEIREHLGLNKPLYEQYGLFLKQLMKGDLGETIWTRQQVWIEIKQRFPATIELSIVALFISCFAGMILGIISATKQYSIFDYISMLGALAGVSMPIFWLGLVFMLIFALNLGWLPMSGRLSVGIDLETITNFYILDALLTKNWPAFRDALWHISMPAGTLSTIPTVIVARMNRSAMLEVLRQDYVRLARARGLPERRVVYRHAFRNALVAVVPVIGLETGFLIGGAVYVESVFQWPGLGRTLVVAIAARDLLLVQGAVLVLATGYVLVNLLADLAQYALDPRIRHGGQA